MVWTCYIHLHLASLLDLGHGEMAVVVGSAGDAEPRLPSGPHALPYH